MLTLASGAPCLADEDYCGEISPDALTFKYVNAGQDRLALDISVPLRDGKAKFHRLDVDLGEGSDVVSFTLRMETHDGRAEGSIYLPRPHKIVHVEAIYHQDRCFKLLKGTFADEKRVPHFADNLR